MRRILFTLLSVTGIASSGCLRLGSGQGLNPGIPANLPVQAAPASGTMPGDSLHAGGVIFAREPSREQWLELISNQSSSLTGDYYEPVTIPASGSCLVCNTFDFQPDASTSVRIDVLDSLGKAVSGARVSAFRHIALQSRMVSAISDASGSVILDLSSLKAWRPRLEWIPTLYFSNIAQESRTEPVVLFEDPDALQRGLLTLAWTRSRWTVRLGLPGRIAIQTQGYVEDVGIVGMPYHGRFLGAGRWTVSDVPAGRYIVTAQGGEFLASSSVTVLPGETVVAPQLVLPNATVDSSITF